MADYSISEINTALAGLIEAVDDTGIVLIDMRLVEDSAEIIALIQSLNRPTNEAKGWLLTLDGIREADRENSCEIVQTVGIKLETLYPYAHRRADGSTSEQAFGTMV